MRSDPSAPPKPPRPANCYLLFRQFISKYYASRREAQSGGVSQTNISAISSLLWRNLDNDSETKQFFRKRAEREAEIHKETYPHYKYSPTRKAGPRRAPAAKKAICGRGRASLTPAMQQAISINASRLSASFVSPFGAYDASLPSGPLPPPSDAPQLPIYHPPVSYIFRPRPYNPECKWSKPVLIISSPYQGQRPAASPTSHSAGSVSPVNTSHCEISPVNENMTVHDHEGATYDTSDSEAESWMPGSSDGDGNGHTFTDEDMEFYFNFSGLAAD